MGNNQNFGGALSPKKNNKFISNVIELMLPSESFCFDFRLQGLVLFMSFLKKLIAKNQEIFKIVLFSSDQDSLIVVVIKLLSANF